MIGENEVIDVLKQCNDPELPIDLWSLGLIYNITISKSTKNKSNVSITMTLTTPGCSMGEYMAEDIKMKLKKNNNINSVDISITFDPPWNPSLMNDEAKEKLGFGDVDNSDDNKRAWE